MCQIQRRRAAWLARCVRNEAQLLRNLRNPQAIWFVSGVRRSTSPAKKKKFVRMYVIWESTPFNAISNKGTPLAVCFVHRVWGFLQILDIVQDSVLLVMQTLYEFPCEMDADHLWPSRYPSSASILRCQVVCK